MTTLQNNWRRKCRLAPLDGDSVLAGSAVMRRPKAVSNGAEWSRTVIGIWFFQLGILLFFILFCGRAFAQCPGVAVLAGDESAREQVAPALEALGVQTTPVDGCAHLVANVTLKGDAFVLRVAGVEEGEYVRSVESAQTVAVLIDSLVQSNRINESSAEAPSASPEKQAATSAGKPIAPVADEQTAGDDGPHQFRRRFQGMFSAEVARNRNPGIWTGSRFGACMELAFLCVGIGGRFAVFVHPRTTDGQLLTEELDWDPVILESELSRYLLDGLLFSTWEVGMGRFSVYSSLSVGVQRIWTRFWARGHDGYSGPIVAELEAEQKGRDSAILFGVQLGGAWFITSQFALDVNLGADIAAPILGGSRSAKEFLQPPVPERWARIAIGLRYTFEGRRMVKP